jgi:hypothetical protein
VHPLNALGLPDTTLFFIIDLYDPHAKNLYDLLRFGFPHNRKRAAGISVTNTLHNRSAGDVFYGVIMPVIPTIEEQLLPFSVSTSGYHYHMRRGMPEIYSDR